MGAMLHAVLGLGLVASPAWALYEDQAGMFDWYAMPLRVPSLGDVHLMTRSCGKKTNGDMLEGDAAELGICRWVLASTLAGDCVQILAQATT